MSFDVLSELNYLAIAVAAAAYFAFGAIWYAPPLMGKMWQRAARLTDQQVGEGPNAVLFVGTYVAYFLEALVLAAIAAHTGASTVGDGLILGLFVGVGIVGATIWVNNAYQRQTATLFWINAINGIIGFVVMAIIVTVWE
ncbi:MAG TPA: DUF1761 domain-containing protein [Actinomycetota bacterium]|jgi:hypothetical protein|nr:DUF1761 domain-containing protein [Actinomycetota bacterium]